MPHSYPSPHAFLKWRLLALLLAGSLAAQAQGPPLPLARMATVRDSMGRLLAADLHRDTLRAGRLNYLSFILRTNEAPQ